MDNKVNLHKAIVHELIEKMGSILPPEEGGVENQIIIDDEHGHYLLFGVGWEGNKWFYASFLHIDVKPDGKVWVQHNGIDMDFFEELNEKGIANSDIVLGFHAQNVRQYTGFAVA